MNAPVQNQSGQTGRAARDLNAAIDSCFALDITHPPFPQRVTQLVAALTGSPSSSAWVIDADEKPKKLANVGAAPKDEAVQSALEEATKEDGAAQQMVQYTKAGLLAFLPFQDGTNGFLLTVAPPGGAAALSLAYERISLVCQLAKAQFRHPDGLAQARLLRALQNLAAGTENALQSLVDELAEQTGADYAVAGFWTGSSVRDLSISGQSESLPRAQEPARLRETLAEIASQPLPQTDRLRARHPEHGQDLLLYLRDPKQRKNVLSLAAALYSQFPPNSGRRTGSMARLLRPAITALVIVGIGFIPIPETARITALVTSENHRILSAPLSTIISEVLVEEGQSVEAGDVLVRLNAREAELELIRLQSERATSVIEQESARLLGNAAELRNAELTVQRLDARIALETFRAETSVLTAPIAGIVILGDLRQRIGTTVRLGDPLLEVSDPRVLQLQLTVLETDIGSVDAADKGIFRPDFNPSLALDAQVTSVSPAIDFSVDPAVARADGVLLDTPENLRPGASGVLHIGDGTRPIWRVLYDNLRDWVLLRVWI
ncbi:MAG: HlyD family efflux transporter periplasmic adaptor subunit [Pseudomonadota bacterium]